MAHLFLDDWTRKKEVMIGQDKEKHSISFLAILAILVKFGSFVLLPRSFAIVTAHCFSWERLCENMRSGVVAAPLQPYRERQENKQTNKHQKQKKQNSTVKCRQRPSHELLDYPFPDLLQSR